ncbi:2-hydroxyacid dehydrogenase [Pseudomonas sp. MWU16-30317]|uniref:2-hydroxyacid dehydrogenase n=1 Tax=Pseudomonas sp. MWU16-30317 TaxID=2878095 RepID=UPI001CFA90F8|nr:2-hydroxyacid dehydrogenase [Pseudomonas sp. MWU16-30317]
MSSESIPLALLVPMPDTVVQRLQQRFEVLNPAAEALSDAQSARVQAVLTNGSRGLSAAEIDAMPALRIASAMGAGHENIDHQHAAQRGIAVTHGGGANADIVADHAMALLGAVVRRIPQMDRLARAGCDRNTLPSDPGLHRRRLGLVGAGHIGRCLAKRAGGYDMDIGYHSRNPVTDWPPRYFADLKALAHWCDFLVVAVPGGAATLHLIDSSILQALGPEGYLVNIGRGSVVDTTALATALREGVIAGAALDVYESEPARPEALLEFENLVLTPHIAGRSDSAWAGQTELFIDNVERYLAGQAMVNPVG